MFEIPDDDENFWEALPLEDITNNKTPESYSSSSGVKRLSSDSGHHVSNKKLRPGNSPDYSEVKRDNLGTKAPIVSPTDRLRTDNTGANNRQEINRSCSSVTSLRVPAVSQHIVTPDRGKAVAFNAQRKRSPTDDSPLQTPLRAKRKFPGPAGLLPKISPGSIRDNQHLTKQAVSTSPEIIPKQDDETVILSSQSGEEVFNETAWQTLLNDLGEDGQKLMVKFSITTSLQKARKKLLPKGKVPLVMAVIESVDWQGSDASVCLKDKSGKIHGTVHQSLMKEHQCDLQPGTVVVLRQVSMISPTARNHYLNITPGNVVTIYSNTSEGLRTIRNNIEQNTSLHSELQNVEPYISEDIITRRRSLPNPSQTSFLINNKQGNTTVSPCIQSPVVRNSVYQERGCQLNSNLHTPQRPGVSSCQTHENSTFQRPASANKFKFVKTPNVKNYEGQKALISHTPLNSDGIKSTVSCSFKNDTVCSNNNSTRIPSSNYNSSKSSCNSSISIHKSSYPNLTEKGMNSSEKQKFYVNRNLSSTDFNSNKINTNNSSSQNSGHTYSGHHSTNNVVRNAQYQPVTTQVVPSRSSIDKTGLQSNSANKKSFRFKTTCNSPVTTQLSLDKSETHVDHEIRTSVASRSGPTSGSLMKSIKDPPRPCFEVDSMWQDDLSDDILSQLSDEML